jgi:hypothetical protein
MDGTLVPGWLVRGWNSKAFFPGLCRTKLISGSMSVKTLSFITLGLQPHRSKGAQVDLDVPPFFLGADWVDLGPPEWGSRVD